MSEPIMQQQNIPNIELTEPNTNPNIVQESAGWAVFKSSKLGMIGLIILIIVLIAAIAAPLLAPFDPITQNASSRMQSPSMLHWLGTDTFGRDILSRVIFGSQTTLLVGFISVAISGVIGTVIGMIAGYKGGIVDEIITRILESMMAIPMLLLGLMMLVALGSNMTTLIIAISLGLIPACARIARGPTMELKEKEYVKAAISIGAGSTRILLTHILPNIIGPVLVISTLNMASAIRVEASLSFLGLGIQPPTPTWGNMIQEGLKFITSAPWLAIYPGIALMMVVIAFNLVGDSFRDLLDPHIKHRRK